MSAYCLIANHIEQQIIDSVRTKIDEDCNLKFYGPDNRNKEILVKL